MSKWKVLFRDPDFDGLDEDQLEEYDNFDPSWTIVADEEPVEVVLQNDEECLVDYLPGYIFYAHPPPAPVPVYLGIALKEDQEDDIILPDSLLSVLPLEYSHHQWDALVDPGSDV